MIEQIYRDLRQVVRSWWLHDRIRASPQEGRSLRIGPGDILLIGETRAEVIARLVDDTPTRLTLCFRCQTQSGAGELRVEIASDGSVSRMIWKEANACRRLLPDDFEVWPRRSMV